MPKINIDSGMAVNISLLWGEFLCLMIFYARISVNLFRLAKVNNGIFEIRLTFRTYLKFLDMQT